MLKPGATGSDLVELLDGKAHRCTALDWKAGRVRAPQWALQLIGAKIEAKLREPAAIVQELKAAPERIGQKAGTRNIMAWNAKR